MKYLTLNLSTTTKLKNAIHNAKKVLTQEQRNYSQVVERSEYEESMWKERQQILYSFFVVVAAK